VTGQVTSD